jgi:hypothetical protein
MSIHNFFTLEIWAPSVIKKPPKENKRPIGENSPNLLTLFPTTTKDEEKIFSSELCVATIEILDLGQVCWHRSCKYFWGKKPL